MTDENFRELLSVPRETRNTEFKRSMAWEDKEFKCRLVKSILGFSNVRDGGYIVIGVDQTPDGTFDLAGMPDADRSTYTEDDVKAYVAEYADPFAQLELDTFKLGDKQFIAIRVLEFAEIPVICRKDGLANLRRGAIYTRTHRMAETAEVPSQSELREILDMALEKRMRSFLQTQSRVGLSMAAIESDRDKYAAQRQELDA